MVTKQFLGFKNKMQLKKHIEKNFPSKKVEYIGKKKILKGVTKSTPSTTSYNVRFK